jgi:hypothetical protein
MKKVKTHKARGRGGRARVLEVPVKSKPVRASAANQHRAEVRRAK